MQHALERMGAEQAASIYAMRVVQLARPPTCLLRNVPGFVPVKDIDRDACAAGSPSRLHLGCTPCPPVAARSQSATRFLCYGRRGELPRQDPCAKRRPERVDRYAGQRRPVIKQDCSRKEVVEAAELGLIAVITE